MNFILPTLAVAFTAICVWLTVRIVNRRERWAQWTLVAVVVGVPQVYAASFGPACWLVAREDPDAWAAHPWFDAIYWPIARCATAGGDGGRTKSAIVWFVTLMLPKNSQIFIPDGQSIVHANGVRAYTGIHAEHEYVGENEY